MTIINPTYPYTNPIKIVAISRPNIGGNEHTIKILANIKNPPSILCILSAVGAKKCLIYPKIITIKYQASLRSSYDEYSSKS